MQKLHKITRLDLISIGITRMILRLTKNSDLGGFRRLKDLVKEPELAVLDARREKDALSYGSVLPLEP